MPSVQSRHHVPSSLRNYRPLQGSAFFHCATNVDGCIKTLSARKLSQLWALLVLLTWTNLNAAMSVEPLLLLIASFV